MPCPGTASRKRNWAGAIDTTNTRRTEIDSLRRPTGLLLIVTTALLIGAHWGHSEPLQLAASGAALLCLALLTPQVSWARRLFVAVAVGLTCWAVLTLHDWPAHVLRALASVAFITAFFVALTSLRSAAAGSAAIVRCGLYLANQAPSRRYLALTLGGHLFALVLNYGAISLFGSLVERSVQSEPNALVRGIRTRRMLLAIQRGFVTTLVWSPLTFSLVMSISVVPGSRWQDTVPYCVVASVLLGVAGWALDTLFRPRNVAPQPRQPNLPGAWKSLLPLLGLLVLLIGLVGSLQAATGLRTVDVVMFVVPVISIAWISRQMPPSSPSPEFPTGLRGRLATFVQRELPAYAPELVLLMCAGYIGALGSALLAPLIRSLWSASGAVDPHVLIGVLWLVPLAGQLGMNPILSVTLIGPLLPEPAQMGVPPSLVVLALVSGWALTGASSPFTATTMLIGRFGGVSAHRAGLVWNGPYTLVSGLALSAWLWLLIDL